MNWILKLNKKFITTVLVCVMVLFALISISIWSAAYAAPINVVVTKIITGADVWSDAITVPANKTVTVCIDPNSNSNLTITLKVQYHDEFTTAPTVWNYDIDDWDITGSSEDEVNQPKAFSEWVRYKIGCEAGDYTSGNATVRISRGAR